MTTLATSRLRLEETRKVVDRRGRGRGRGRELMRTWAIRLGDDVDGEVIGAVEVRSTVSEDWIPGAEKVAEEVIVEGEEEGEEGGEEEADDHEERDGELRLSSRIAGDQAGRGFSTEAVKAVLLHLFGAGDATPTTATAAVSSRLAANDTAAAASLLRLGFVKDEHPSLGRDGRPVDGWAVWSVDRPTFLDLWTTPY
ncbi:hypothetical protein HK100_005292 [Physocladia obscura]|uniref:Uncharacterized protein n=1 Tax=Physocladia obscura TaxID=109957 RepID=A0AAD5SRU3_9FUNG|nr:hypothetical protein HK100_005292 [Physocladia obscura]